MNLWNPSSKRRIEQAGLTKSEVLMIVALVLVLDGSVLQFNTAQLRQHLTKTGDTTNLLVFPQ